jgi:hypothetical protein
MTQLASATQSPSQQLASAGDCGCEIGAACYDGSSDFFLHVWLILHMLVRFSQRTSKTNDAVQNKA